jgi:hypothetical protein
MNDIVLLKDIHRKFGKIPLKTYPLCGILKYRILYKYFYGMRRVYPLDYVVYDKEKAMALLHEKFGWTKYENKHYENVFTRFFEGYYLPNKFGFDTRKNVCSNQILAGTMTRNEALKILNQPPYDIDQMELDKEYIAKKLGISTAEFDKIISQPKKTPSDYKNQMWIIKLGVCISRLIEGEKRNLRF